MPQLRSPKAAMTVLLVVALALAVAGGLWPSIRYWAVVGASGCSFLAIIVALQWISRQLWVIRESLHAVPNEVIRSLPPELHSMHVILQRFPQCTLPTSAWSMRFSNLHAI